MANQGERDIVTLIRYPKVGKYKIFSILELKNLSTVHKAFVEIL